MDIPLVKDLIDNAKTNYISKLKKEKEKREKNRESWSNSKKEEYSKSLEKIKLAHDNYVSSLEKEVVTKTKHVLKENYNCRKFILINPQNIPSELLGLTADDIYKGLWNVRMKRYERIKHYEAGIELYPIEEVNQKLEKYGYFLEEVEENNEIYLEVNLKI